MPQCRSPPSAPPIFTGDEMIIIPDVERLIDHVRQVHESILANINTETATFENIILPLAIAHNLVTCKLPILGFYEAVSANSHLRDDSTRAKGLYTYFDIETKAHEGLFALIDAVLRKNESLDPESRRLLERTHRDYIRHGLGVPAQQRERFKAIQKQLAQLISKFEKNLRDHDEGIWFTTEELVGVPEDAIEGLKQADGKVFMTFDFPHLFATLKFASNEDTRRRYYIAHENRCQPNVALFKDIMVLRHEAAQLLGYPNHAAFRLEDKMAKKPEVVMAFLDDLHSKLSAGGRSDIEGLKRLKNANLTSKAATDKFYLWDYAFYNRLMLETEYFVDRKAIAEYFPLQTTVTGVMRIFEHLFGLVFEEIVDEARDYLASTNRGADLVWHEDVQMFAVWDDDREGGGFLGYLYLDLHPRPGKFGGMSNMNLQGAFEREDGSRECPATALICNFTRPTTNKPSLLGHEEVQLFFHELGHGIHDLVAKTKYSIFHGTATVDDFCEAPSQMLEYWCWLPQILQTLSHHYSYISPDCLTAWRDQTDSKSQPPKQLPIDVIDRLFESKNVNGSLYQLRLLHRSYFDMKVHQPRNMQDIIDLDISAEYNKQQTNISFLDSPEGGDNWGHGHAKFDALVRVYDAGFYGYVYSRVYATDMFYSVFKQDPMDSTQGRRYRHTILEKGASVDETETLREFLGRDPNNEAFYQELGLVEQ